jgi:LmbE family N-acetylglucosaminyl deacetylase
MSGANEPGQPGPTITFEARSTNLPTPTVALAIGAHPDDIEFGCGGTLAKWAADGCVVHHLVCTDGSKGTWDVDADLEALVDRRQVEQRSAAARLSGDRVGSVTFLGYVDGELDAHVEARGRVAEVIRTVKPEVVLGHDPWKRYRLHPDHRHAGLLTVEGLVAARDPHFFPELGIAHHRPEVLLLFEADEVDHVEDVTGYEDTKLAALEAHRSQFESTMFARADDGQLAGFRARVLAELAEHGALAGIDRGEAFKRLGDL